MGHCVFGFITAEEPLREAARALGDNTGVCPLALGFALLPLTDSLVAPDEPASDLPFCHRLTARLATWAEEQSNLVPIVYIETDYFGGTGAQSAVVWREGKVDFGPVATGTDVGENVPLLEGAINRAARHIGVCRGRALDEFDALCLGRHRENEDWVAAAERLSG